MGNSPTSALVNYADDVALYVDGGRTRELICARFLVAV
jgi:hypothetical protein